jgi:hypothetical protein
MAQNGSMMRTARNLSLRSLMLRVVTLRSCVLVSVLIVGACGDASDDELVETVESVNSSETTKPDAGPAGATAGVETTLEEPLETASSTAPTTVIPARFYAITNDTYELVEVDSATGEIFARFGGWGQTDQDCDDDCFLQAIDSVEQGSDGRLWLTDCCEPAAGSIYALVPGESFDAERPFGFGLNPVVSPDERLLARASFENILIGPVGASGDDPAAQFPPDSDLADPPVSYTPLTWLDDVTLVVRSNGAAADTLILVDASEWSEPIQIGPTIGGLVRHPDAAVRADGMIVALATAATDTGNDDDPDEDESAAGQPSLVGQVFDPRSGEQVAEFDLPDDVYTIDYDPSGTFLLTSGDDGVVRWLGLGQSGELASGYLASTW